MNKRLLTFLTVLALAVSLIIPVSASEICGTALNSDIITYINNYAIETYIVDGTSVVVAEDLRMYGFDVLWNGEERTLSIYRNSATEVTPNLFFKRREPTGSKYCDLYTTDIKTSAAGKPITAYNMNGYTMVPVEELTMLGNVQWYETERILKMTVDGLASSETLTGAYYRMYALDGRHLDVDVHEADAYKTVGWYLPEDLVAAKADGLINVNGYATAVFTMEEEAEGIKDYFLSPAYEKMISSMYKSWHESIGVPVAITKYNVDFTEEGYPRVNIYVVNVGNRKIKSFKTGFECYDANIQPIPDSLVVANTTNELAPREKLVCRWVIKKYPDTAGIASPEIVSVTYEDGTVVEFK